MTTARYYTPSGRSIQATGITPDIIAEQELPEDLKDRKGPRGRFARRAERNGYRRLLKWGSRRRGEKKKRKNAIAFIPPEPEDDAQLQKAIELLIGLQKVAAGIVPAS